MYKDEQLCGLNFQNRNSRKPHLKKKKLSEELNYSILTSCNQYKYRGAYGSDNNVSAGGSFMNSTTCRLSKWSKARNMTYIHLQNWGHPKRINKINTKFLSV